MLTHSRELTRLPDAATPASTFATRYNAGTAIGIIDSQLRTFTLAITIKFQACKLSGYSIAK